MRCRAPSERARLLAQSNRVAPDRCEASVHELFAAQPHARPDAIAVREGAAALSYAELDARANQLARFLGAQGVQRGSLVAVAMERGVEMTVALLGILKARCCLSAARSGASAPVAGLDARRRRSAAWCSRNSDLLERLPAGAGRACCIDRDWADIARNDRSDPGNRVTGGDTAYVMYTSGSTGRPKGVVIPHRAIVRLVIGTDYLQLGPGDVVAHIANPAFDASTFEIWGALLNGARARLDFLSDDAVPGRVRRARSTNLR